MQHHMEATLVFQLRKLIEMLAHLRSKIMDILPHRSRSKVRARPGGSIRSRWLRMIVHETKSDRRMRMFGRDPLR